MQSIYEQVWRNNLEGPGFALIDVGPVDSRTLRQKMMELKDTEFPNFKIMSLSRFDQQRTTRFHQDGAPPLSVLMLGYEPSKVRSRLKIADHACAANDLGINPKALLGDLMWSVGEERLEGYTTELQTPNNAFILVINNSDVLGVAHQATVWADHTENRIINSIVLVHETTDISDRPVDVEKFLTTDFFAMTEDYATS